MEDWNEMKKLIIIIFLFVLGTDAVSQSRTIEVGGKNVAIQTFGIDERKDGDPLVIFVSGLGTPMDNWDRIKEEVSASAPLLIFDRPGIGSSEYDGIHPTLKNTSDHLLSLLKELEQEPPYLLVGHSLGGVYVRGFAVYYPEMLAGLVIIDPGDFTETRENKRDYFDFTGWDNEKIDAEFRRLNNASSERLTEAPDPIKGESRALKELRDRDFKEIIESPLPDIPVHMIASGGFSVSPLFKSDEYDGETYFRSKTKHRMARWTEVVNSVSRGMLLYSSDAGHFIHWEDPELVISSIRIVLKDYFDMRKN